jgi:ABC-type bacteriocin/lantibiotic exporter with double-glycine peptidase domain
VLDESLAALDPATTRQVLDAASRRAPALLLIAHP